MREADSHSERRFHTLLFRGVSCLDELYRSTTLTGNSCRRRDVSRPASVQSVALSPAATTPSAGYFDTPPLDIVPKRSPTAARPLSLALLDLDLSTESDLISEGAESQQSNDSEAARYLSQFYAENQVNDRATNRRPRTSRTSTAGESGIPSLSHTPISSFGTAASGASYKQQLSGRDFKASQKGFEAADVVRYPSCGLSSIGEHVKDGSMTSGASTLTSLQTVERADVSFDKQHVTQIRQRHPSGSLRQLLSHEV